MELLATTGDAFVRVGARTQLQGSGAHCLALDGDTVYVGCRGDGLKRSADGGDTFEDVPLPESDVFSVAVSAADGAVYAGTEPSRLFCSRDGGESWDELVALQDIPSRPEWSFPPRPWTSHVRWIAPSPLVRLGCARPVPGAREVRRTRRSIPDRRDHSAGREVRDATGPAITAKDRGFPRARDPSANH